MVLDSKYVDPILCYRQRFSCVYKRNGISKIWPRRAGAGEGGHAFEQNQVVLASRSSCMPKSKYGMPMCTNSWNINFGFHLPAGVALVEGEVGEM